MIDSLIFGEVSYKIDGFDVSLLTEKLYKSCKVISLYTKNDSLYLTTSGRFEKKVLRLCESSDCVCEITERRGAVFTLRKYFKRFGFAVGAIVAAALIFFLSNTVMKIEVTGVDDENVIREIRSILKDEGLYAGTYIPSLNYFSLANKLFASSDNVAWASIGNIGSVVYVNVSTPSLQPQTAENKRIPCDIVASRDAVIVNAEVLVGQLDVLIGDAVYKGQKLVSGRIERREGYPKFYHSYARITGRYGESVTIEQKYVEEALLPADVFYRKSLNIFELEIPLPGDVLKSSAEYSVKSSTTPIRLFGIELPLSVTVREYTELCEDVKSYSTAEAFRLLYERLENYEKEILDGVTVVDRKIEEISGDDGVALKIDYVLEGEIGVPSEIYIK